MAQLPLGAYEASAAGVVRVAVEALVSQTATLAEGGVATTSVTRALCNHRDGSVAGWTPDIDDAVLEERATAPYAAALEWDTAAIYAAGRAAVQQPLGPAPETAAVDAAVTLLGVLFPLVPAAAQEAAVETLLKAVKATKFGSPRRAATQANIVTALLAILRTVTGPGRKGALAKGKALTGIQELLQVPLILTDQLQRVAAAEAMGRLATAMGASFISSLIKSLLDTILNNQDASTRAGYILALGCVLRHVGGTGVSAHLQSTIGTVEGGRAGAMGWASYEGWWWVEGGRAGGRGRARCCSVSGEGERAGGRGRGRCCSVSGEGGRAGGGDGDAAVQCRR